MQSNSFHSLIDKRNSQNPVNDEIADEKIDFGRFLAAVGRHKVLVFGVMLAVTSATVIRSYLSPSSYQSSFEILIQPSSAESDAISSLDNAFNNRSKETISLKDQVRILSSPAVLNPAAESLLDSMPELCRSAEGEDAKTVAERQRCAYSFIASSLRVSLIEEPTANLEGSRIVRATYESESEETAQLVADTVAETYLDYGLESRQKNTQQALEFLDNKLPDIQSRVNQLQSLLQALRQNNNLITPDARSRQLNEQIINFRREYLTAQVELEELEKIAENLDNQLDSRPQDTVSSAYLSQSVQYQALAEELLSLDSEIAQASTLFLEDSPDMQVLRERRQVLLSLLGRETQKVRQELAGQIAELESRETALADTLDSLDADVQNLAAISRQFIDIERELSINTDNLNRLLERRESLLLEAAQRELPWELITPTKIRVQSSSLSVNLVLGGMLGLLLGIGVALLLDLLGDVIYTTRDLKRITRLPILGLLPQYDSAEESRYYMPELVPASTPISAIKRLHRLLPDGLQIGDSESQVQLPFLQEAARSLMTNVRRIESDSKASIRSIVVSSADEFSQTPTVATLMARAAATMGEKVLLVDANMRFPHLHNLFGNQDNSSSWIDCLGGKSEFEGLMQQSPSELNLYMLPTGVASAEAIRLLSSKSIRSFIDRISPKFDLIIFDAPSAQRYADAALIAAESDGLILSSSLGQTKSLQLKQVLEKLWISKINVLGIAASEAA